MGKDERFPIGFIPGASADRVSMDAVFSSVVSEAAGFYKTIVAVASSFLGGSLLFMERIAPDPTVLSLVVLGIGWVALICSIGIVATVRRLNLESGWRAMEGEYEKARKVDERTRARSKWAVRLLILGMAAILFFGMLNVRCDRDEMGGKDAREHETERKEVREEIDTIREHGTYATGPATDGAERAVSPSAQAE